MKSGRSDQKRGVCYETETSIEQKTRTVQTKPVRNRTHKFIAGLLSAIIPGLGHIYLRLYMRGLTFMLLVLLDLSAVLYFSSIGIQINVPLLILLALCIPVIYFYNVYDVLQSADWVMMRRRRAVTQATSDKPINERSTRDAMMVWERGISFGLLLIVGGSLMVLFSANHVGFKSFSPCTADIHLRFS